MLNRSARRRRKAVSPVIATLILIAISVAVAIIAYSWITGIVGGLQTGGGQQATEQLSVDAYDYIPYNGVCNITVRNVGVTSINITSVYFDGASLAFGGSGSTPPSGGQWGEYTTGWQTKPQVLDPGATIVIGVKPSSTPNPGSSHLVTFVTSTGAKFQYTVIAGRTG